jgi:DNA helicase-2/ATP-dependent DNA helicase PcrA
VRHNQFGEGKIVACDGRGPNARVTVSFPDAGLKRIIAKWLERA